MGVSWYLRCIKCHEAYNILMELEHYDSGEALESEFPLYTIEDYSDKPKMESHTKNVDMLLTWINKHKGHGGIIFTGN